MVSPRRSSTDGFDSAVGPSRRRRFQMKALDKLLRRWQLRTMGRLDAESLVRMGARRLVRRFHQVAGRVPAYAELLEERGVAPGQIRTLADFLAHCPVLEKGDLFGRFPLHRLCVDGSLAPLTAVLTSSGQGGRFAFGLSTARQARRATGAVELGLEHAFQTDRQRTLLVNALPMGVRFSCSTVTLAETSVREDMVTALIGEVAPYQDQTILVLDPLFCKRLLDCGRDRGIDWASLKVHLVLGEETFGEHFRAYVANRLGQDPEGWTRGLVISSMGVGELGLNLFFETAETVRLRQLAQSQPDLLASAIGRWPGRTPPLLFVYDPRRIFVEIGDMDHAGFGALTVSTLDPSLMLPLLRYRTGDRARILDSAHIAATLEAAGRADMALPALPMIAMAGREQDFLPDGRAVLDFKDALYARPDLADGFSGAFRIEVEGCDCRIHVQLREGLRPMEPGLAERLGALFPRSTQAVQDSVRVWSYLDFPFGKTLDYERKFSYYQARALERPRPTTE